MIIKKDALIQSAGDIDLIEAVSIQQPNVVLKMTVREYIDYCIRHDVRTIFFRYEYYDLNRLLVSDDLIEEYAFNPKERAFLKEWADEYNSGINGLDPSRPFSLSLMCCLDSLTIGFKDTDYWFDGDKTSGQDALVQYIEEHENEIDDLIANDYDDHTDLMEEFEKVLLDDRGFRLSTTISSRKQYIREFLAHKENKKYLALARRAKWDWEQEDQLRDIANRLYQEYRTKCRELKLHPGDALPDK